MKISYWMVVVCWASIFGANVALALDPSDADARNAEREKYFNYSAGTFAGGFALTHYATSKPLGPVLLEDKAALSARSAQMKVQGKIGNAVVRSLHSVPVAFGSFVVMAAGFGGMIEFYPSPTDHLIWSYSGNGKSNLTTEVNGSGDSDAIGSHVAK